MLIYLTNVKLNLIVKRYHKTVTQDLRARIAASLLMTQKSHEHQGTVFLNAESPHAMKAF